MLSIIKSLWQKFKFFLGFGKIVFILESYCANFETLVVRKVGVF